MGHVLHVWAKISFEDVVTDFSGARYHVWVFDSRVAIGAAIRRAQITRKPSFHLIE